MNPRSSIQEVIEQLPTEFKEKYQTRYNAINQSDHKKLREFDCELRAKLMLVVTIPHLIEKLPDKDHATFQAQLTLQQDIFSKPTPKKMTREQKFEAIINAANIIVESLRTAVKDLTLDSVKNYVDTLHKIKMPPADTEEFFSRKRLSTVKTSVVTNFMRLFSCCRCNTADDDERTPLMNNNHSINNL